MARGLERGDVRLYQFDRPDKLRPVLVLTRSGSIDFLTKVTIAPITSTVRGTSSEVQMDESDGMKGPCAINLHNLATVQQEHLGDRITKLSDARMEEVCAALRFALGCD